MRRRYKLKTKLIFHGHKLREFSLPIKYNDKVKCVCSPIVKRAPWRSLHTNAKYTEKNVTQTLVYFSLRIYLLNNMWRIKYGYY